MENEVIKLREALLLFGSKDIDYIVNSFKDMLTNQLAPASVWQCIANGSFKECYDLGESNFIIKFACNANDTQKEKATLQFAIEEGFGATFPQTIYIPLSIRLPVSNLDHYYSQEYRYTYHTFRPISEDEKVYFNYVIIQKRIAKTAEQYNEDVGQGIIKAPNSTKILLHTTWFSEIEDRNWIVNLINKKGEAYFQNLDTFLDGECIKDLHDRNIGYAIDGEPVIFDWLS